MSRNNDVFSVLVADNTGIPGGQDLLDAGNGVTDLLIGQIGIFDAATNLSVDATVTSIRDFYIAVGTGTGAPGTASTDYVKSAGTHIQLRNLTAYTLQCYTATAPSIWQLTDFTAECETEYALKFEIRNQRAYHNYGFNQFTKSFHVVTGCCDCPISECPTGDCNELAELLYAAVNADEEGWIIAEYYDYVDTEAVVEPGDLAAWYAAHEGECIGLQFTSVPDTIETFCKVNHKYLKPRETTLLVSMPAGFECNGTLTEVQAPTFEQGSGYDIAQLEMKAHGWKNNFGPYRQSNLSGIMLTDFSANANTAGTYLQVNLTYDQFSVGGWQEYLNNLNTTIAIDCNDSGTIADFYTVLEAILALVDNNFPLPGIDGYSACDCGAPQ